VIDGRVVVSRASGDGQSLPASEVMHHMPPPSGVRVIGPGARGLLAEGI